MNFNVSTPNCECVGLSKTLQLVLAAEVLDAREIGFAVICSVQDGKEVDECPFAFAVICFVQDEEEADICPLVTECGLTALL